MADKVAQQKDVESTVEEVDKPKSEKVAEEKAQSENGSKAENGEDPEEKEENGTEVEEKEAESTDATDKVCCVKRKSTAGEVTSETTTDGATPEKKAKLDETTEAESNGDAEVAA